MTEEAVEEMTDAVVEEIAEANQILKVFIKNTVTCYNRKEGNTEKRIFPDKPITRKPQEVRMGKGKGNPEFWAAVVEPGRIIFELEGVSLQIAQEALDLAAAKLPIKTKFIVRRDYAA